jgi:hypothetical protein
MGLREDAIRAERLRQEQANMAMDLERQQREQQAWAKEGLANQAVANWADSMGVSITDLTIVPNGTSLTMTWDADGYHFQSVMANANQKLSVFIKHYDGELYPANNLAEVGQVLNGDAERKRREYNGSWN